MKLVALWLAVAAVAVAITLAAARLPDHLPVPVAVAAIAGGLWLAFERLGLGHWYVGLHGEAVRVHYNVLWANGGTF